MDQIYELLAITLGAILANNFIFSQFLGICPFLGVSKKVDTAVGMGIAVTFVMGLASAVCYAVNEFVLVRFGLEYMQTVTFILVIASLVQFVEMFLQKSMPSLYTALGRELQGLSLRNVGLAVFEDRKKIYTDFGEMLFTHFGVSGPLVLSASAQMRHFGKKTYRLEIDLKPALDEQALDKRLLRDFEKYANHDFCNALDDLLPQKLIPVAVERSGIPPHQKVHDLTREQRRELVQGLKHFSVEIAGPCPVTDAIVTSGGIKISEIDPKTMESKLVKGLYFSGEIMDVDAYTGGFNLQIAWATGRAAGQAAAEALRQGEENA